MQHSKKIKQIKNAINGHPSSKWLAAIIAIIIMLACHIERQCSISIPGGPSWAQYIDMFDVWINGISDTLPDDVLLIDATYDRENLPIYEPGIPIPIGTTPVTDRRKILDLLQKLQRTNCYRFIMLDILFAADIPPTPADSALFHTIATMPRILIPKQDGYLLADSILYTKARYSEYDYSLLENNFVKYPTICNGEPSISLSMYEQLSGDSVTVRNKYFATSRGHIVDAALPLHYRHWLCPSSLLPSVNLYGKSSTDINDGEKVSTQYISPRTITLGHMCRYYNDKMIATSTADKIVIIGGLTDGDIHSTYSGDLSGALINLNAYEAMSRGEHRISYIHLSLTFILFYIIWIKLQCNLSAGWLFRIIYSRSDKKPKQTGNIDPELLIRQLHNINTLQTMLTSWIGIPIVLSIYSLLTYWIFGTDNFNVFWPTVLFNFFYFALIAYRYIITKIEINKSISKNNDTITFTDNETPDTKPTVSTIHNNSYCQKSGLHSPGDK